MLDIHFQKYTLYFRFEAGTSRGVLTQKDSYFIKIADAEQPHIYGLGEAAPLQGLSPDDRPDFEQQLARFVQLFRRYPAEPAAWEPLLTALPSLRFAVETALADLQNGGKRLIFDTPFSRGEAGLPINGLIWMGSRGQMLARIEEKLQAGFNCLKMKIGSLDFEQELSLLAGIRSRFSPEQISLRVDANGAFAPQQAMQKLEALAQYQLHSIEQPIKAGQWEQMAQLCAQSPLPIALDEELIGLSDPVQQAQMLDFIRPQYIILKPTLLGGLEASRRWIELAQNRQIGWWMTSALEANIGLNAISQFTATYRPEMPQGLGTGQLYHNNIDSPLEVKAGEIRYKKEGKWEEEGLFKQAFTE